MIVLSTVGEQAWCSGEEDDKRRKGEGPNVALDEENRSRGE